MRIDVRRIVDGWTAGVHENRFAIVWRKRFDAACHRIVEAEVRHPVKLGGHHMTVKPDLNHR
jgi:hypothetical protein